MEKLVLFLWSMSLQEEIMTMERILLQTIKFDLMVEHPYAYLLKFAKLIKGDFTSLFYVVCWRLLFICLRRQGKGSKVGANVMDIYKWQVN